MKRRFATRRGTRRPANVQWSDVSGQWLFAAGAVTTATPLIQLQSPAALNNLTADPPEDLTILRVVGTYTVLLSAVANNNWTLALTVADVTWTPGATVSVDNDKRLLWQQTYETTNAATGRWTPPGMYTEGAAQSFPGDPAMTSIDISPRVKVEAGKALYLVAYENNAAVGGTITLNSYSMRVLYRRSGRR